MSIMNNIIYYYLSTYSNKILNLNMSIVMGTLLWSLLNVRGLWRGSYNFTVSLRQNHGWNSPVTWELECRVLWSFILLPVSAVWGSQLVSSRLDPWVYPPLNGCRWGQTMKNPPPPGVNYNERVLAVSAHASSIPAFPLNPRSRWLSPAWRWRAIHLWQL